MPLRPPQPPAPGLGIADDLGQIREAHFGLFVFKRSRLEIQQERLDYRQPFGGIGRIDFLVKLAHLILEIRNAAALTEFVKHV